MFSKLIAKKVVIVSILVLVCALNLNAQQAFEKKNGVDWIEGAVYATTAFSGVDINRMTSKGQAEQEAVTQAYDLACVQLNKEINGLSIDSKRLYERSATKDNILKTETKGIIRNARIYSQKVTWEYFKGQEQPVAEVTVIIPMAGKKGLIAPVAGWATRRIEDEPQLPVFIEKERESSQEYTGLIIDATETSLQPVLSPKI